jgi:hypothetical protein
MRKLGVVLITLTAWAALNRAYTYLDELSQIIFTTYLTVGILLVILGTIKKLTTNRKNSK